MLSWLQAAGVRHRRLGHNNGVNIKTQKIARKISTTGVARGHGLPADQLRRHLLQAIAVAPLLLGMPAKAEEGDSEGETAQPFPLSDVRLLDGHFRKSQSLNALYLESLNCDRLLHNFRKNAGLAPKAPVYGGWEAEGLQPRPWKPVAPTTCCV